MNRVFYVCTLTGRLLSLLLSLFGALGSVEAVPIDSFSSVMEVECGDSQTVCRGFVRGDQVIGRYTGVSIEKSTQGTVTLKMGAPGGGLMLDAQDVPDLMLTLSWDGDSNAAVLSGAGLNCFDLTQGGAHAFVMSHMQLQSVCMDDILSLQCPHFAIESRVYDSRDPTGQKFSASVVTRKSGKDGTVVIPFSNFIRSGSRGHSNFTCGGAITITLTFQGFQSLKLELGPVRTNGGDNEEAVEAIPTVDPSLREQEEASSEPESASLPPLGFFESPRDVFEEGHERQAQERNKEKQDSLLEKGLRVGKKVTIPASPSPQRAPVYDPIEEVLYGSVVIGQ